MILIREINLEIEDLVQKHLYNVEKIMKERKTHMTPISKRKKMWEILDKIKKVLEKFSVLFLIAIGLIVVVIIYISVLYKQYHVAS